MTERSRSKSELKLFFTNLKRRGITDDMMAILIEMLWRDKYTMRSSGFYIAGGPDAQIAWDDVSRTFTIEPTIPDGYVPGEGTDWIPRFSFYAWAFTAKFIRKWNPESIQLPNEEGLYMIYYAPDENNRANILQFIKNPTEAEKQDIYMNKVIISSVYWDYDKQTALCFGDDRHGSQWNPQMHWYLHTTLHARRHSGLQVTGMEINQDGSLDAHARFRITAGKIGHDDFLMDIPGTDINDTVKVLCFSGASHLPGFVTTADFQIYMDALRVSYNNNGTDIIDVDNGNYVCYHLFAVNDLTEGQKIITVMGLAQYGKLAEAFAEAGNELITIRGYMPQQGQCYLGTVFYQADSAYANAVKARVVGFTDNEHPPVSIADDSLDFLTIDENQQLSFILSCIPDNYLDGVSFNTINGDLIFVRTGGKADLVENLDGRYLLDAPVDSRQYVRKDGAWTIVDSTEYTHGTGINIAGNIVKGDIMNATDNTPLASSYFAFSRGGIQYRAQIGYLPFTEEAPNDENSYVRRDKAWAIAAGQIQSDWNQTNTAALDYIKNKPAFPDNYVDAASLDANAKLTLGRTGALPDLEAQFGTISLKGFWYGTQAQYDALGAWDDNTLYHILEE